jgi:hypothetical protein
MDVIVAAAVTLNDAVAVLLVSAAAVATTVTAVSTDMAAAVKRPVLLLIVPAAVGAAVHVTEMSEEPVTVAPNWMVPPEPTVVGRGSGDVMEIETLGGGWVLLLPLFPLFPPQPVVSHRRLTRDATRPSLTAVFLIPFPPPRISMLRVPDRS